MASTRSPSPNPSRTTSPKLLPQESGSTIRKSGSLHHSKTSICSELPQKNSSTTVISSATSSPRAFFEQKENERDTNYSKLVGLRSPAKNHNKPVKSFMAPTISASSKVKSASPRKKILAERNELVQDYMKSPCASVEGMRVEETKSRSEIECGSVALSDQNGSGKPEFSFSRSNLHTVAHCRSRSPEIASSDADPSLPSYDPMTNYLSPRPRFLHYKPNPRIEQLHDFLEDFFDEGDGRKLEDSFSGSEDDCEFNQLVQPSAVKEGSPGQFSSSESETEEVQVSDERESRPKFEKFSSLSFGRSKLVLIIFILILLLFYVPWSDTPFMPPILLKNQSFSNPCFNSSTFFQEVNLQDYVANHGFSSANPLRKEEFGMFIFNESLSLANGQNLCFHFNCSCDSMHNCKEIVIDREVDDDIVKEKIVSEGFDGAEDNVEETVISEDVNKILYTEGYTIMQNHEVHFPNEQEKGFTYSTFSVYAAPELGIVNDNDKKDDLEKVEIVNDNDKKDDVEKVEIEFSEDLVKFAHSAGTNVVQNLQEQETRELEQKDGHLADAEDIKSSSDLTVEFDIMDKIDVATGVNSPALVHDYVSSEVDFIIAILVVFSAVLIAITSLFILMKQKKSPDDVNSLNKTSGLISSKIKNCKDAYGSPTEMSSSANNSLSFGQRREKKGHDEETPSYERMQRRESGASSSISYGSFTTYEKFSGRKGTRDDEAMTPVRRSSRIRNQVTSP